MKKTLISLTLIGSLGCCSGAALAATMADTGSSTSGSSAVNQQQLQQLQQEIADLQKQLASLQQQQQAAPAAGSTAAANQDQSAAAMSGSTATKNASGRKIFGVPVVTGPSVRRPNFFDGSNLFVNYASVNRDQAFLQREADMFSAGMFGTNDGPHVVFSGNLEAQVGMQDNSNVLNQSNKTQTAANLTNLELDTYITFNRFTSGYMTFSGSTTPSGSFMEDTTDSSDVSIDLAQMIFGNFNKSPFYAAVGQSYVPFGRYSYGTVDSPLTKDVARTKARNITVGYAPKDPIYAGLKPYGEAFVFNGTADDNSNTYDSYSLDQVGVDGGMSYTASKFNADLGVSWMNNASDLGGINGTVKNSNYDGDTNTSRYVSNAVAPTALDVHGHMGTSLADTSVNFIGEYVQSLGSFNADNLAYRGSGAKPQVGTAEIDLGRNFFNRPFTLAFSGSWSAEAVAAAIPRDRYQATATVTALTDVLFSLGYTYDKNYSGGLNSNTTDTGGAPVGGHDNRVIGQVDFFF